MKRSSRQTFSDDTRLAGQLAALAHPARLEIVRWLARRDHCHCKDVVAAMPLAQSTVSQHLKVLADAGLIKLERERPRSRYRLDHCALSSLCETLDAFAEGCCAPVGNERRASDNRNPPHV